MAEKPDDDSVRRRIRTEIDMHLMFGSGNEKHDPRGAMLSRELRVTPQAIDVVMEPKFEEAEATEDSDDR